MAFPIEGTCVQYSLKAKGITLYLGALTKLWLSIHVKSFGWEVDKLFNKHLWKKKYPKNLAIIMSL